jgi:hypothetical protein
MTTSEAFQIALQRHRSGRLDEAIAAFRGALEIKADLGTMAWIKRMKVEV